MKDGCSFSEIVVSLILSVVLRLVGLGSVAWGCVLSLLSVRESMRSLLSGRLERGTGDGVPESRAKKIKICPLRDSGEIVHKMI